MKKQNMLNLLLIIIFSSFTSIVGIIELQASFDKLRDTPQILSTTSQQEIEKILIDQLPYKRQLRDVYSLLLRAQGKSEARDFYITKTEDGYLQQANYFAESNPNIKKYAKQLEKMTKNLNDTTFLYVGSSGKYIHGVSKIRPGYPTNDVALQKLDELFLELSYRQINTLDLRKIVPEERDTYQEYYYKTHSVWTDIAAFQATIQIMDELQKRNSIFNYDKKYALSSNYRKDVYSKKMVGDQLRSTGIFFTTVDDLELFVPNFPVNLTYKDVSKNVTRQGDYYQSVINPVEYARKDTTYFNASNIYFGSELRHLKLINNQIETGGKIILLTDNYFLSIAKYLVLMNKEVEVIVTENETSKTIEKLIENEAFDAVVVATQSTSIQDSFYNFYK